MPASEDTKEQYIEGWTDSEKRGSAPNCEDQNINREFCNWQQAAGAWKTETQPIQSTSHVSSNLAVVSFITFEQKVSTQLSFSVFSGHEEPI